MSSIDLQNLVQRMSAPVRASLEGAALAVRHRHDVIELHHWLGVTALDASFRALLDDVRVSAKSFADEIDREINTLPIGQGGTPAFSGNVIALAREGWIATSLDAGRTNIAFEDLLAVLADDASLRSLSRALTPSLRSLDASRLLDVSRLDAERARRLKPCRIGLRPCATSLRHRHRAKTSSPSTHRTSRRTRMRAASIRWSGARTSCAK